MLPSLRAVADALLAVAVAPRCVCCQSSLEHPTQGPVCSGCWSSISPVPSPICAVCGDVLTAPLESGERARCLQCLRRSPLISLARAAGVYEGRLREIVHAFKYDGRRSLAAPLARLMRDHGTEALDGADAVVAVPLHPWRRRERGFNQAQDLAICLGLPLVCALRRSRRTQPQADLPAVERAANVSGAFLARSASRRLRHATVVLVDDVMTTGATIEACARVLQQVGTREIRALTAARVVARPR